MEFCNFGSEMICGTEQVADCFFGGNWENQMDQSDPFESALSSMVSSPAASTGINGGVMMTELIGRLGSICSSGEISPQFPVKQNGVNSANDTSCYNTPLSSPPKLNLSVMDSQMRGNMSSHPGLPPFSADPGFAQRAAKFSCFAGLNRQFGMAGTELPQRLVPRMALNNQPNFNRSSPQDGNSGSDKKLSRSCTTENGDSKEESSVSEQIPGGSSTVKVQNDGNGRKRRSIPRGISKESPSSSASDAKVVAENDESSAKRSKQDEGNGEGKGKAEANWNGKAENNGNQKQNKETSKPPEPPKDYIHVRARRGQATDSHSLAERVRREKISERMKFLQDLVPGCNKVTGKAVMLDEIINYVQSLQRQVEFLSMKLANVNPRMDLKMESLLPKDILQTRVSSPHTVFPATPQEQAFSWGRQFQQELTLHDSITTNINTQLGINQVNGSLHQNPGMQLPLMDGFVTSASQVPLFWEDDLQSIVQMGLSQNQQQGFHGEVKTEM